CTNGGVAASLDYW
nr:immunoglobulin heavy chain junction region [Macaca mulatta]MOW75796.1 immunoglobulin heavy chain junction region [Macaca mulatta]MOW75803.1 immunoglobulin heavy chain junction region [Macaca mulatta]MOW77046.1 immunoglobulin heavy chain junction region [Macaca mulatta]MOW79447.1 immunoglobulin heavy chain junction region [Macaca mulatta]